NGMADEIQLEPGEGEGPEPDLVGRRDFLIGLKKWSAAVIGGAVLGAFLVQDEAQGGAWVNNRGGYGGGGRGEPGGGRGDGGAGRVTVAGGGGGAWVNGRGGGGGAWVNGRGGGGAWVNRRY